MKKESMTIIACAHKKAVEEAEWCFGKMVKERVTPDEKTYNSLINASAQGGQPREAGHCVIEMLRASHPQRGGFYSGLIDAAAQAGNLEELSC